MVEMGMLVYAFQVLIVQVSKAMFAVTNPGVVLYPPDRMKILKVLIAVCSQWKLKGPGGWAWN